MKLKAVIIGFLVVSVSAFSQSFNSLHWVSDNFAAVPNDPGTVDLVDSGGTTVPTSANWVVQMFSTADANMAVVGPMADPMLGSFNTTAAFGVDGSFAEFAMDHSTIAGLSVFSVIYNATSIGAATEYAIIDDAPFVVPGFDNLAGLPGEYNAGEIVAGDWQSLAVVPEPSTYAMILCGIGLMVFRRFRKA